MKNVDINILKPSEIIKEKIYINGGSVIVNSVNGKTYIVEALEDGKSFFCSKIPIKPPYEYRVFDIVIDMIIKNGGKAYKGNGRNYRLGYGKCTEDTVVGTIAKNYSGKNIGESVFDPVFVIVAILEWAGIVHNRRGYIEITSSYLSKLEACLGE